jgi:hypothetical protein
MIVFPSGGEVLPPFLSCRSGRHGGFLAAGCDDIEEEAVRPY